MILLNFVMWAEAPKKKVKKWDIPVSEIIYNGMSPEDLKKPMEMELEMATQDRLMGETRDEKNDLLAYVYNMRHKVDDEYREFVTESERDELTAKLQEVEEWLVNEGDDKTKGVYVAKHEELNKLGETFKERYKVFASKSTN